MIVLSFWLVELFISSKYFLFIFGNTLCFEGYFFWFYLLFACNNLLHSFAFNLFLFLYLRFFFKTMPTKLSHLSSIKFQYLSSQVSGTAVFGALPPSPAVKKILPGRNVFSSSKTMVLNCLLSSACSVCFKWFV